MPFKDSVTVDEFNALPETDRQLYIKKDGENGQPETFTLHPGFQAERTSLSNNNKTILDEKKRAADALKPFQELGLTVEQIAELKQKADEAAASKLTDEQKRQRAEQAQKEAHQRELDTLKTNHKQREDFLMRELRRFAIDTVADVAIQGANPIEGALEVLRPHVRGAMDLIEEGEGDARQFVVRMVDGSKSPRYVGSEFMTPPQFVEELKNKPGFGGNFKAEGTGGGGAGQQSRATSAAVGTTMKRSTFDGLSPDQQRAHIVAGGKVVD